MKTTSTYAVMGITGQVGGATARTLLNAGHKVRGIARDKSKAAKWESLGVEIAAADYGNVEALAAAFRDTDGVFLMVPPYFAPAEGFPETRANAASLRDALAAAMPARLVALSSIGAQRSKGLGLITQSHIFEKTLAPLPIPATFLRPGWFLENSTWDVDPAMKTGIIPSFLQPLDKPVPMVSASDVGRIAAESLQETWTGVRIVELEGPARYSPNDIAEAFSKTLGRPVSASPVPRNEWEAFFKSQGTADPSPRIEMIEGFNTDWISFEGGSAIHLTGQISLSSVIQTLVDQRNA